MGNANEIIKKIASRKPGELTDEDIGELLKASKNIIYASDYTLLQDSMRLHLAKLAEYFKCREDDIYIGGLRTLEPSKSLKQYKLVIGDVVLMNLQNTKFEYQYIIGGGLYIVDSNYIDMSQLIDVAEINLRSSKNVDLTGVKRVGEICVHDTQNTSFDDIETMKGVVVDEFANKIRFNKIGNVNYLSISGEVEFPHIETVKKIEIERQINEGNKVKFGYVGKVDKIDIKYHSAEFDNIESVNTIWLTGAENVRFGNIKNNVKNFDAGTSSEINLKCPSIERVEINESENVRVAGTETINFMSIYSSNNVEFPDLKTAGSISLSADSNDRSNNIMLGQLEELYGGVTITNSDEVDLSSLKNATMVYLKDSGVILGTPNIRNGITSYNSTIKSPKSRITGNDIGNATADVPTQTTDNAAEVVNGLLENTKKAPTV